MGKFDGYLICSDIDGTLIDDNFKIPKVNLEAIRYFESEGGKFTLSTGRTPQGAKLYLDEVKPSAPIVCQNGAAIFDCEKKKYIWAKPMEEHPYDILEYVLGRYPEVGVEVLCESGVYYVKENFYTTKHMLDEKFEVIKIDYKDVKDPWLKLLFAEEEKIADEIQKDLEQTEFAKKYQLARTYSTYYEAMNRETNKGVAVRTLADILSIDIEKVITIGDNDNDAEMLKAIENSYAVKNASAYAKESASYILDVDNNEGSIANLIEVIENKMV